jgi:hypothetical protein
MSNNAHRALAQPVTASIEAMTTRKRARRRRSMV